MQFCHNAQKWERCVWQSDETSTGRGRGSELQKLILYNRMRLCYDGYIYEKRTLCGPEGQKACEEARNRMEHTITQNGAPRFGGRVPLFSQRDLLRLVGPLLVEQLLAVTVGMADTMVVSVLSMAVWRLGFSYLLCVRMGWGAVGVWIAMVIDWVCRVICFVARMKSGAWKTKYQA